MPAIDLYPNGAGVLTEWNFPLFDAHWSQVDEGDPHDGDATCVMDSGVFVPNGIGRKDFYSLEPWPLGSEAIIKVEVLFVGRITAYTGDIRPGLYNPSLGFLYGLPQELTTSWTEYAQEVARPGGGAWSAADIADLQCGIVAGGGSELCRMGNCVRCTRVRVRVTYTEDSADIGVDGHVYWPYSTTVYLTQTKSDLGPDTAPYRFDKKLLEDPGDDSIWGVITPAEGGVTCHGFTELGTPNNADWESGAAGVAFTMRNATEGSDLYLKVSVSRVSESGDVLETSPESDERPVPHNQYVTYGFTVPSVDWSAGDASDRLRVNYIFRNAGSTSCIAYVKFDACNKVGVQVVRHRAVDVYLDGHIVSTKTAAMALDGWMEAAYESFVDLAGYVMSVGQVTVDVGGYIFYAGTAAIKVDGHITLTDTDGATMRGHVVLTSAGGTSLVGHVMLTSMDGATINGHIAVAATESVSMLGHIVAAGLVDIDTRGHVIVTGFADADVRGYIMSVESAHVGIEGFVGMIELAAIGLAGCVTDRGMGTLSGPGWFKTKMKGKTGFWTK